jgi:outer membrane biosynthesis protein TonB
MSYSLILNREPRLFYLSAYRNKKRLKMTLVPGANLASKTGLSTEDLDAIRTSTYVRDLEARGSLEFVTEEPKPEAAAEPEPEPKPEPKPEAAAEPEPEPKPEKKPKRKRKPKTKPEPGREPAAEPEPEEGSDLDSDDF